MLPVAVAVDDLQQISAANVVDLATGHSSVLLEEERVGEEEVVEAEVDAVEDGVILVEEDQEVKDHLLLWLSRGQKHLGVCCNKLPMFPQGPVAVTRETSCALSWPARTAAGAVGRPGAS